MSKFQSSIFRKVKDSLYQEPIDDVQLKAICNEPCVEEEMGVVSVNHYATHEHYIPQQALASQNPAFFTKYHPENAYFWVSCYPIGADGVTEFHEGYSRVQQSGQKAQVAGKQNFLYHPVTSDSDWISHDDKPISDGNRKQSWLGRMFSKKKPSPCIQCSCNTQVEFAQKIKRGAPEDLDAVVSKRVRLTTACALDRMNGNCTSNSTSLLSMNNNTSIFALYQQNIALMHGISALGTINCGECTEKQLGVVMGGVIPQYQQVLREKVLLLELEYALQNDGGIQDVWNWYTHPQRPLLKAPIKSNKGKNLLTSILSLTSTPVVQTEEGDTTQDVEEADVSGYSGYGVFEFHFPLEDMYSGNNRDTSNNTAQHLQLPCYNNTYSLDPVIQCEEAHPQKMYCLDKDTDVDANCGVLRSVAGQRRGNWWIEETESTTQHIDECAYEQLFELMQTQETQKLYKQSHKTILGEECKDDEDKHVSDHKHTSTTTCNVTDSLITDNRDHNHNIATKRRSTMAFLNDSVTSTDDLSYQNMAVCAKYDSLRTTLTPCSLCFTRELHSVFLNYNTTPCCAYAATKQDYKLHVVSPDLSPSLCTSTRASLPTIYSLYP